MKNTDLDFSKIALLIVDVQEKLLPVVAERESVLNIILKLVKAFQILELPIYLTEQYPEGLGNTVLPLKNRLGSNYHPWKKTAFSCLNDPLICEKMHSSSCSQWIVVGLEAHVCVLQTVKSLIREDFYPIVIQDAIASRSLVDLSTALIEMRQLGARVTSFETLLFECLQDSKHPHFKEIQSLILSQNDSIKAEKLRKL